MEKEYKLRPFQEEDAKFLQTLNRGACFNEQRTGKTPVILTVLKRRNLKRVLILCPKSALPIWKTHIKDWYPDLKALVATGTYKQKEKIIAKWTDEALILSMDSFKQTRTAQGFIKEILKHRPNVIILDEAHRIQNRNTSVTKAIFKTTKIKVRYALTGTPAISKSHRIWTILHWLYPEYFRAYWKFIDTYFTTYTIRTAAGTEVTKEGNLRKNAEKPLWDILNKFCTQRKRKNVMAWLPEKDHIPVLLTPTTLQLKYLSELEEYFETEQIITSSILSRLIRYRQICLDPNILGLKGTSPKTKWVLDYLQDYPEEKIIIFSKFTTYLEKLHKLLPEAVLFTGKTSEKQRESITERFQNGSLQCILANIDAAREALTWDAASTEIFTDKYPPVGAIEQAEDRFIATTPEKANKPHKIYELQLEGTYDETIYQMLRKQKSETDLINDFKNKLKKKRKP